MCCCQDCAGVWGGVAYLNDCKKCINGNVGKLDNQFSDDPSQQDSLALNNAVINLKTNCVGTELYNLLEDNYGLSFSVNYAQNSNGQFDPCTYNINFSSLDNINSGTLGAEMFHAYQQQLYNGELYKVSQDPNHTGGSNLEFEERAYGVLLTYYQTGQWIVWSNSPQLTYWLSSVYNNHGALPINLSPDEISSYFDALEEFRANFDKVNAENGISNLYNAPIDKSLLPNALFNILNSNPCGYYIPKQ
jgi:hypothetical protein